MCRHRCRECHRQALHPPGHDCPSAEMPAVAVAAGRRQDHRVKTAPKQRLVGKSRTSLEAARVVLTKYLVSCTCQPPAASPDSFSENYNPGDRALTFPLPSFRCNHHNKHGIKLSRRPPPTSAAPFVAISPSIKSSAPDAFLPATILYRAAGVASVKNNNADQR